MTLYTSKVIAQWLCLTERRVRQLRDEGVIVEARPGLYELQPTVARYIKYLGGAGKESLNTERMKLTAEKRKAAEMDNDLRRGDLHSTNSGGGDVFAAQTIGNLLEQHTAQVTARIDGLCASAATIIACHCDKVVAANDSTYMIHPVRMGIFDFADAVTLQQYIGALNTIRENILNLYTKKTGREKDEVAAWMDATSWWTGEEAKTNGFVDELVDDGEKTVVENRGGLLFVNSVNMNLPFDKAPKFVQNSVAAAPAASGFVNTPTPAEQPGNNSHKEDTNMANEIKTVDELRGAYPALVDQIEQAAALRATNAERQRIRDIEEMALPGSEQITNEAKYDKPMSASDYAKAAMKNAKEQGAAWLNTMQQGANASGVNSVGSAPAPTGGEKPDEFMDAIKGLGKKQ